MKNFVKSGKLGFLLALILITVLDVVCGVTMLSDPLSAMTVIDVVFSTALIVFGIFQVIDTLFGNRPGISLLYGLMLILLGSTIGRIPGLFSAFSPVMWSFILLFGGFGKLAGAIDLKRIGVGKWWLVLILAILSIILGFICLLDPISMAVISTQFVGAALLVEAVFNVVAAIIGLIFIKNDPFMVMLHDFEDRVARSQQERERSAREAEEDRAAVIAAMEEAAERTMKEREAMRNGASDSTEVK